ncbi:hypothetical protein NKG94_28265 [Micromonospora sp. M12]
MRVDRWRAGCPEGVARHSSGERRDLAGDVFAVAEAFRAGAASPRAADRRAGLGLRTHRVRPVAHHQVARRRPGRQAPGVRAGAGVHSGAGRGRAAHGVPPVRRSRARSAAVVGAGPVHEGPLLRRLPARGGRRAAPDPRPCRGRPPSRRGGCRSPPQVVVRGVAGLSALGGGAGAGAGIEADAVEMALGLGR